MIKMGNAPSKTEPLTLDGIAAQIAALQAEQVKLEAEAQAKADAERDAAIRENWTAFEAAFAATSATMPEGDKPLDLDAMRTAFAAMSEAQATFAASIKAPKVRGNRAGTRSHEGSILDQVTAYFRQHPEAIKPGALTTNIGRPSSGAVRNVLVGANYSDGEPGGMLADGLVEVTDASVLTVKPTAKFLAPTTVETPKVETPAA